MNTILCTPSFYRVQFVAPFSLLFKPLKKRFSELVRSRYGEGTEQVFLKVRSLLID